MSFRNGPFCMISTFTFSIYSKFWCYTFTWVWFWIRNFNCNRVFLHCSIATFTKVKYLNTSSTAEHVYECSLLLYLYCHLSEGEVEVQSYFEPSEDLLFIHAVFIVFSVRLQCCTVVFCQLLNSPTGAVQS